MSDAYATVDRIEEGVAVLLVERDGEVSNEQHVSVEDLPEGVCEGCVLACTLSSEGITDAEIDSEETRKRRERTRSRFDRLSRRADEKD